MTLARRPLGRTGAEVFPLGFGVSGPHSTGFVPRSATVRMVSRARAHGVNVFDTAPFYGDGVAEKRLGLALEGVVREDVFISTKAGTVVSPGGRLVKDFTPIGVRAVLEKSLSRLQVDHVDALLLHGPAPADLAPPLLDALTRLKREGLVRFVGVCGRGAEIDVALDAGVFDLLMTPVHIGMAERARERVERAREIGLGVMGIEALKPSLSRVRFPRRPSDVWYTARGVVRGGGAPRRARRPIQECLAWALREGGAHVVMTTTTRRRHLEANIAAAESAATETRALA